MSKSENFLDEITKVYKDYQKNNYLCMNSLNNLQRKFGYKEIYDMTIRAHNALARSIKYFKDNGINYYGEIDVNHDRLLMLSCEAYVLNKFQSSQIIFVDLVNKVDAISKGITDSLEFKIKKKYANKFPILYKKQTNYKDKFAGIQSKVEEFLTIGEELDNFDPSKDLIKTYDVYIPILFNNMNKVGNMLYKDDLEAKNAQYVLFHNEMLNMIKTLFELGKYADIQKLCALEQSLIYDDAAKLGCDVKALKKKI